MVTRRLLLVVLAEVVLVLLGTYGYVVAYSSSGASAAPTVLTGAGATLAYPLLSSAAHEYETAHPGVLINYQPLGSVAGVNQFILRTIDFGATYPPMSQTEVSRAPSAPLHIPEALSAVVVAYNLPGVTAQLRLNGTVIANIFMGNITTWNDPAIASLNPGVDFPAKTIVPAHMAEAEGTTFVFSSYLSQVSTVFQTLYGVGTQVSWPQGSVSVLTDAGVAELMTTSPYTIGYMELSYAIQNHLQYATILNADHTQYVNPSTSSAAAAAATLSSALPAGSDAHGWSQVALLNEPGNNTYPLVTFTYIIVYKDLTIQPSMDQSKAKALVGFLWYLVHDGQGLGAPLGYVPLPQNVVTIDEASLRSISFQGQALN